MNAMPFGLPSSLRGILKFTISPDSAKVSLRDSSVVEKGKPPTNTSNSLLPLPPLALPLPSPLAGGGSEAIRTLSQRPPYSVSWNFNAFSQDSLSVNEMKQIPLALPSSLRGKLSLPISPHSPKSFLRISSVDDH